MKIAFIVFDGITLLDLVGLYDPISRLRHMGFLPSLTWDFCSFTPIVEDRIVEDRDIITAGAVTASIDLGLYLCRN